MTSLPSIQSRAAEKIIQAAVARGVSASSLCEAVGLSPAAVRHPDNRIPFAQVVSLYEQAAALSNDQAFGLHVGEAVDARAFDVLGYSVINSADFGAALERVVRYHYIWTNGAGFAVNNGSATVTIVYRYLDGSIKEHRHDAEMTLAAVISLGRRTTGVDWSPELVSFEHPEPRDISEHRRIFRCPVKFAARANEFVFKSSVLDLPMIQADPGLCAVLDRHAAELLARYPPEPQFTDLVRKIIQRELKLGNASLDRIADHLGMSSRTLQRKLKEQGTSHQDLLDNLRKDLALRYLRQPKMAICEVAYLLGFSESSALHRAFKRWTGITPCEFRRQ